MLLRRFLQLLRHVAQRSLAKKIHPLDPRVAKPVDGFTAVHESQRLDPVGKPLARGPLGDLFRGADIALRDPRRSDLDPVDLDLLQEHTRDVELLVLGKSNARRLLSVPQCRVHDLNFHDKNLRVTIARIFADLPSPHRYGK